MVRKTKEEAQETRNGILAAAAEVFWEKGVASATLENIAEKAGVTRGAIYWHFKNKYEIFEALHEQLHSSLLELIYQDMERDNPQPLKQLAELCIKLFLDLDANSQKKKILSIFFLRCDYSGEMECFLKRQNAKKTKNTELFARYFHKAKEKGHLAQDADPDMLTLSLLCFITGTVYEYLRNPALFDMKTQAPQLVAQFFLGVNRHGCPQKPPVG